MRDWLLHHVFLMYALVGGLGFALGHLSKEISYETKKAAREETDELHVIRQSENLKQ